MLVMPNDLPVMTSRLPLWMATSAIGGVADDDFSGRPRQLQQLRLVELDDQILGQGRVSGMATAAISVRPAIWAAVRSGRNAVIESAIGDPLG